MSRKRLAWSIGFVVGAGMLAAGPAGGAALTYHPLTPCRIVDTRVGSPLAGGEIRAFNAVRDLAAQGGTTAAGGCLVPSRGTSDRRHRAEAIVVNLVAVAAAGPGHLSVFAGSDAGPPNASVINYVGGQTIAVGTTIPLRTDQTGNDFKIQAAVSGTHVVVDVMGYYSRSTSTTFAARLKSIPGSTGDPVTIWGPITGSAAAVFDPGGVTLYVPPHCTAQNFTVLQTVPTPGGGGIRAISLRKDPDTVVHNCILRPGDFSCESAGGVAVGENGAFVFLQSFSAGAVPSTEARVTFQLVCD